MKVLRNIGITVIILVVAVFLLQQLNILPAFGKWFRSQPVVIENTPVLVENIRDMSQLITIVSFDEVVVTQDDVHDGRFIDNFLRNPSFDPMKKKISVIVKGRIFAGMDLKDLKEKDLFVKNDSVSIILPPVKVLDAIVNPSDYEIFIEEGRWETEEVNKLVIAARERMLKRAQEKGLLIKAKTKAKAVMESFFRSVGFKKIAVVTS
jgi:hypothetical protein